MTDNLIMDKDLLTKLAKRIRELRKQYGYTQDDLAFKAGIERSTLGNIETVQNDITFSKVNKIASVFNLSLSEFLNF
jgi:transcriptional regulator with XRE-family HTH domain